MSIGYQLVVRQKNSYLSQCEETLHWRLYVAFHIFRYETFFIVISIYIMRSTQVFVLANIETYREN